MPVNSKTLLIIRVCDLILTISGLIALAPLLALLFLFGLLDTGSPLFCQQRIGRNLQPFILVKFRTMQTDTQSLPSHLVHADAVTHYGYFRRRTKLDELPQIWNVVKGEMSLVGPRPNLCNQKELIAERSRLGIYQARPGITGLAQLAGIDMSSPVLLARKDAEMLATLSLGSYFKYIFLTLLGKGAGDAIK